MLPVHEQEALVELARTTVTELRGVDFADHAELDLYHQRRRELNQKDELDFLFTRFALALSFYDRWKERGVKTFAEVISALTQLGGRDGTKQVPEQLKWLREQIEMRSIGLQESSTLALALALALVVALAVTLTLTLTITLTLALHLSGLSSKGSGGRRKMRISARSSSSKSICKRCSSQRPSAGRRASCPPRALRRCSRVRPSSILAHQQCRCLCSPVSARSSTLRSSLPQRRRGGENSKTQESRPSRSLPPAPQSRSHHVTPPYAHLHATHHPMYTQVRSIGSKTGNRTSQKSRLMTAWWAQ
jgi:hypothetical protein